MEITWHGHSCFTIKTKNGAAVINPYQAEIGLKLPSLKANVILESENTPDYNNVGAVSGEPKVLDWPGEYEVAGIAITAHALKSEKVEEGSTMMFLIDADGLKICYLTDLKANLSEELIEEIGEVDILIVPVGKEKEDGKRAHEAVEEIEPRAVIPMQFNIPGLKNPLEEVESFAKQAGIVNVEMKDKFVISAKNDLPEDKTEFVILKAQVA